MVERRTRANGRASREAIMAAALEVFAERGYRGTSLTEIANRVGMTQPGLLHHFPTKDDMLLAVVQQREAQTEQEFAELIDPEQPLLLQTIQALATINQGAPVQQLLLTTLSAESIPVDHPLHQHFVARYRRLSDNVAEALRDGIRRGQMREELDPDALAREIIATLDGIHLQWLLDPQRVDLPQALSAYAKRMTEELKPTRRRRPS